MLKTIRQILKPKRPSVIEDAKGCDLRHLSEIHGACFNRGWTDGEFQSLLAQDVYNCVVARRPGKAGAPPSGFVLTRQILDEAEIITIAVKPSARKKGIASALMREVVRRMEADRVKQLFLEVDQANHAAIALYKGLGFTVMDRRDGYYVGEHGVEDKAAAALVMRLDLG